MRRVLVLSCGIAVLVLASCGGGGSRRGGTPPRHALLVTVAGMRADHLSFALYPRPTTYRHHTREERLRGSDLSLDAIAARGVFFAQAFAPSGSQTASLTTLHTGAHPVATCVYGPDDELPGDLETLAERFAAHGFRTAAFTSGFQVDAGRGLGRGFETVQCLEGLVGNDDAIRGAGGWITELESDERFFLWLHLQGPVTKRKRGDLDVATYDADLARVGDAISGFLAFLAGQRETQEVDFLADTALVLTAPHGLELGEHGGYRGHRESLHEAVLRVPLVLHHPRSLTGKRVLSDLVELDQLAETLGDWFELAPERPHESLLLLADGGGPGSPGSAVAARSREAYSIRTAGRRLIWTPSAADGPEGPAHELFDVAADPRELNDIAAEEPGTTRLLKEALIERLERVAGCLSNADLTELRRLAESP